MKKEFKDLRDLDKVLVDGILLRALSYISDINNEINCLKFINNDIKNVISINNKAYNELAYLREYVDTAQVYIISDILDLATHRLSIAASYLIHSDAIDEEKKDTVIKTINALRGLIKYLDKEYLL